MSGDSFDANGEAHEALSTAVSSYGARVLGDPRILGNLVTDLLPDNPRERSLLVAAAEAGVAAELTQHVEGQHLDVETAIALVARSLTENRLLDPAASTWVSTEYAQALGYQVRPQAAPTVAQKAFTPTPTEIAAPPQSPPIPPIPAVPPPPAKSAPSFTPAASAGGETRVDLRPAARFTPAPPPPAAPVSPPPVVIPPAAPPQDPRPPAQSPAPAAPGNPWQQPAPAATGDPWQQPTMASIQDPWAKAAAPPPVPPAPQPQNAWQQPAPPGPAQPGQAQPWPTPSNGAGSPPWPSVGGSGPRRPRRGLLLGGTIAVILVLYMVIAAVAHTFPFSKATPKPSSSPKVAVSTTPAVIPSTTPPVIPSTTAPVVPSTTPPAGPTLAAGVKPLKVLLPTDIADASTECSTQTDIPWTNPGLVRALDCTAPDLPGGDVFGYQVDNGSDFAKAWANYNTWAKFGKSSTEACPPPSGQSQAGPIEWSNNNFPSRAGQVLECFSATKGEGVYVWTYPTENTFIIVQAPKSWSWSQLHQWWRVDAA